MKLARGQKKKKKAYTDWNLFLFGQMERGNGGQALLSGGVSNISTNSGSFIEVS